MSRARAVAGGGAALLLALATGIAPAQTPPAPSPLVPPAQTARRPFGPVRQVDGFTLTGSLAQGGMVIGTAPPEVTAVSLDGQAVPMTPARQFLIAFGRDHGPSAALGVTYAHGKGPSLKSDDDVILLDITPGTYRIEALPIPKYQQPEAEFLKIRAGELDQIKAARAVAVTTQSDGWQQGFQWPVIGRVSGAFGAQRVYNGEKGSFHSGEDIAIPTGTPVRAPADGVVILAATEGPFTLEGHLLMVAHGMGLDSAFLHLSHIDVKVGDVVRQGQVIGESGMTGRATGPHLHWSLTWRGERIDPKLVTPPMPGGNAPQP